MIRLSSKWLELLDKISGCWVRDAWGIYCPGCGGTRALKALLRGDILKSLYYNPLVVVLIVSFLIIRITHALEKKESGKRSYTRWRFFAAILFLGMTVLVFAVRNYMLIFRGIDMLGDFN